MGLDNELRVQIVADTAGLEAGLSEAQGEVATTASSMADAQNRAAIAARNLADAQMQLGASAKAGNAAAKAIIAEYQAANEAAQVLLGSYVPANEAAAVAANTAAAGATRAAQAFTAQGVSANTAALGGIRVMEGSMMGSSRAAAAFLSNTLGLGGVLAAAFPVIGALALGMVIVDVGEEIVKFSKEASDLSDIMNSSWLDGAIAALTGLGDALKEDKKQLESWEGVYDKVIAKEKEDAVRDAEAKGGRSAGLREEIAQLKQKADEQDRVAANLKVQLASEKELAETGAGKETLTQLKEHPFSTIMSGGQSAIGKASADAARDAEAIKAVEKQAEDYRLEINRKTLQAMEVDEKAYLAAQKKEDKPVKAVKDKGDPDKFAFIKGSLEDANRAASENERILEAIGRTAEEEFRTQDEDARKLAERDRQSAEEWKRNHENQIAMAKESAEAEVKAADDVFEATKLNVAEQLELGKISHKTATHMLLDAQALKEQTTQGALKKVTLLYDPAEGGKELAEFKRAEDQMTAEARKAAREREQIEKQEQQNFIKGWKAVTNEFNQDFTQAFNSWMTHSETAGKAFGSMLGELERQTIDFVAMYILKKAEMWAMDEAMQALGIAKQHTQQGASNVATVTGDAGTAAAGAMAYYTPIDPTIAPTMAQIAFGQTMSYATTASFTTGGVVPGMMGSPVPAIVHAGERVLTASQNSTYENLASSSRATSVHMNYAPTIHGNADAGMLQEHSRQMLSQVRRMVRPEALA